MKVERMSRWCPFGGFKEIELVGLTDKSSISDTSDCTESVSSISEPFNTTNVDMKKGIFHSHGEFHSHRYHETSPRSNTSCLRLKTKDEWKPHFRCRKPLSSLWKLNQGQFQCVYVFFFSIVDHFNPGADEMLQYPDCSNLLSFVLERLRVIKTIFQMFGTFFLLLKSSTSVNVNVHFQLFPGLVFELRWDQAR